MMKIAIIGGGISGLTLANELADSANVTIFEKARGVGGRTSSRYAEPFSFDHGAQCFTARTSAFKLLLNQYIKDGIVSEWNGLVLNLEHGKEISRRTWNEKHFVATPNMNSLCKAMAKGLDIQLNTEISSVNKKEDGSWLLASSSQALGLYDLVISTAPPIQTMNLFRDYLPSHLDVETVNMHGCYALMIGFNQPWRQNWIAAKVHNNKIKWISINSSKPGRNKEQTCFVVHSHNTWANKHINDQIDDVQAVLLTTFEEIAGVNCKNADYIATHRWRYSIVKHTQKSGPFFDSKQKLGCTGDWSCTSRIEEVWLNAVSLAAMIKTPL